MKQFSKKEAMAYLNLYPATFDRYTARFGIIGEHKGRVTYFKGEDIDYLKTALDNQAAILIRKLEKITGKEVRLI